MRYLLFDCDGTLLDSMEMWNNMAKNILKEYGVDLPMEKERETASMSHKDACIYYAEHFGNGLDPAVLLERFEEVLVQHYTNEVEMKPHVRAWLDRLHAMDVPMAVASSTDEKLLHMAFERLDMEKYFRFVQSVDNTGFSKDSEAYYAKAAERFGTDLSSILFFDDALYALKRAKSVGIETVAVFDAGALDHQDDIRAVGDHYIHDFSELPDDLWGALS